MLPDDLPPPTLQKLARHTLTAFLATFVLSRVFVLLIMTHHLPDMFLWVGGTHVHHLNYGIFLLVGVGGWGVFSRPRTPRWLKNMALVYGVALALTFDEFGMWLHLDDNYWQRGSYDAVVWVGAALGLIAAAPSFQKWNRLHWVIVIGVVIVSAYGLKLMGDVLNVWQPFLQDLQRLAPQ